MIFWKMICLAAAATALPCCLETVRAAPTHQVPATGKQTTPNSMSKKSTALASMPDIDGEETLNQVSSLTLTKEGDDSVQHLLWKEAGQEYSQALTLWPDNKSALYGLAKCSQATGDKIKAVAYYREAIYSSTLTDSRFREGDVGRLMEYAILLASVGQEVEALLVYNHAAYLLDYQDRETQGSKSMLAVLLPELTREPILPDQVRYTQERLHALAEVAIAHEKTKFGSNKEAIAHMQEAVRLYPNSPVTNYYLGEVQLKAGASIEAKVAYQKAARMGDAQVAAAAKVRLAQ